MAHARFDFRGTDYRFWRPWLIGALVWGAASLVVLAEYRALGDLRYLTEIGFLLSLLWGEFGFAAMFHAVLKQRGRRLQTLFLITVIPPLLLHLLILCGGCAALDAPSARR